MQASLHVYDLWDKMSLCELSWTALSPVSLEGFFWVFFFLALFHSSIEEKSFSREQRGVLVWKEVNLAPVLLKDLTCFLMKTVALQSPPFSRLPAQLFSHLRK